MIVWINGTHGAGKTTTGALVQRLIPDSRVFDAEKVGETLMDITPGLPETDNFQHWPPWRPLVVETARHVLDYTGGTLVMPMTVLIEQYWREISAGLLLLAAESLLVAALVVQLRRRERIERELEAQKTRYRTVADFTHDLEYWRMAQFLFPCFAMVPPGPASTSWSTSLKQPRPALSGVFSMAPISGPMS